MEILCFAGLFFILAVILFAVIAAWQIDTASKTCQTIDDSGESM